jgi:hypothetical protein
MVGFIWLPSYVGSAVAVVLSALFILAVIAFLIGLIWLLPYIEVITVAFYDLANGSLRRGEEGFGVPGEDIVLSGPESLEGAGAAEALKGAESPEAAESPEK